MKQQTFTDFEYNQRKKKTHREEFLDAMDAMIPWSAWIAMILPFYPSGKRNYPVKGIETMLRMYLMQIQFNRSDVAIEDGIYDSYATRTFMCIDFTQKQVPESTILRKFRYLLEQHHNGEKIFADMQNASKKKG